MMAHGPLTDPRSLAFTLALHLSLLGLAALIVLPGRTQSKERKRPMTVELAPADTRPRDHPDEPGGGPGALGGQGASVAVTLARPDEASDPALAAYLAHNDDDPRNLLDPDATNRPNRGVGVVPGAGPGGGGGHGGGSGGGIGRGVGTSAEFFGLIAGGRSFGFVIDRSGSMGQYHKLDMAKRELVEAIEALAPDTRFAVIPFDLEPDRLSGVESGSALLTASAPNKRQVIDRIKSLRAFGGTDHIKALRAGLATGAEVIFYLTDGRQLSPVDAEELLQTTHGTRIQVIEFGLGPASGVANPGRNLATRSGGKYLYVDVREGAF